MIGPRPWPPRPRRHKRGYVLRLALGPETNLTGLPSPPAGRVVAVIGEPR